MSSDGLKKSEDPNQHHAWRVPAAYTLQKCACLSWPEWKYTWCCMHSLSISKIVWSVKMDCSVHCGYITPGSFPFLTLVWSLKGIFRSRPLGRVYMHVVGAKFLFAVMEQLSNMGGISNRPQDNIIPTGLSRIFRSLLFSIPNLITYAWNCNMLGMLSIFPYSKVLLVYNSTLCKFCATNVGSQERTKLAWAKLYQATHLTCIICHVCVLVYGQREGGSSIAICEGAAQLGVFSGILGIVQGIFFLKFGVFQGMLFEKNVVI